METTAWMNCSQKDYIKKIYIKGEVCISGLYSLLNENSVIIYSASCCFKPVWIPFFCWTQKKIFWRMSVTRQLTDPIDFLLLCSLEERNSFRFETTWGNEDRVNDDRILILKWTNPLKQTYHFDVIWKY